MAKCAQERAGHWPTLLLACAVSSSAIRLCLSCTCCWGDMMHSNVAQRPLMVIFAGCACSPGGSTEITPHAEWLRQAEMFAVLKRMPFFKQHHERSVSADISSSSNSSHASRISSSSDNTGSAAAVVLTAAAAVAAAGLLGQMQQELSSQPHCIRSGRYGQQ